MATPLIPQQQHIDGGGGVAVLTNLVPPPSSSSTNGTNGFNRSSLTESPILIFSFFQKAIGNELDALHRLALDFATGNCFDIGPLSERYHFLRSMYRHHSNAEDEVHFFIILFFFFVELWNFVLFTLKNEDFYAFLIHDFYLLDSFSNLVCGALRLLIEGVFVCVTDTCNCTELCHFFKLLSVTCRGLVSVVYSFEIGTFCVILLWM